jgi:hypothetical protein
MDFLKRTEAVQIRFLWRLDLQVCIIDETQTSEKYEIFLVFSDKLKTTKRIYYNAKDKYTTKVEVE